MKKIYLVEMKNLLVTGAAGGIGSEIASHASKNGYRVGLMDANHEKLKETITTAIRMLDNGIVRFGSLLEQEVKDFEDVINVNLLGCFIVSCAVARLMKKKGSGNIVNISSISGGKHPAIHSGAYAASKAGVVMLSEQMSLEWGKEGIRVNAISPGFIDAGMSSDHYVDPVERKKREGMVPIQKIGSAEDIANVVMFLLSDDSSYVHGENIVVDGGVMNSVLANIGRS